MNFQYCYSKDTKVRILTLEIIFSLRKEKKRRIFHVFMFEKDKIYDYKFSEKRLRKIRNFPYDHQSIYRENQFIICNIQFITSSCWNE